MHGLFKTVVGWVAVVALILGLTAAAVGPQPAYNLARQLATYGGQGFGATIGSLPVFFDNYQQGSNGVQGGGTAPVDPTVPAP